MKDELIAQLIDSAEATTIINTKITEFSGTLNYEAEGVAATLVSDAKDELRSEIRTDGQINALIDTKITAFDQSLNLVTDSDITSAVNSASDTLQLNFLTQMKQPLSSILRLQNSLVP